MGDFTLTNRRLLEYNDLRAFGEHVAIIAQVYGASMLALSGRFRDAAVLYGASKGLELLSERSMRHVEQRAKASPSMQPV